MNNDRASRVWTAVALRAMRDGETVSVRHACLACVQALQVRGAALTLTTTVKSLEPVYATNAVADRVEQVQCTVGQGPAFDALVSGQPVLVEDLSAHSAARRWPLFAPEADRLGVRAMYSLPLTLGALHVGVLDLYHDTSYQLDHEQLVDALVYADTALLLALDEQGGIVTAVDGAHLDVQGTALWHAEVHQAAGMVSVQTGTSVLDALVRLRGYAYAKDRPLTDIARAVVHRRLRFQPDGRPRTTHEEGHP